MSLSPSSSEHHDSAEINNEIPWDSLECNLVAWLKALGNATCSGNPRTVLALLEAFVKFICCNDGSFLRTIVSGHMTQSLRDRGAPDSLIKTFTEVIQCTGGMEGAILSFGTANTMPSDMATEIILRMQQAQRSMGTASPEARSPRSPGRANYLPQRTTQDMLDQLWHDAGSYVGPAGVECLNNLQISNFANAVATRVDDLSPAILNGLECADAVPFLILRWLNSCLVEAFFCIHYQDTTYVLKRTVVYVGPKPGTQVEGGLALEIHERLMLEGNPHSLPWTDAAGFLAAPTA